MCHVPSQPKGGNFPVLPVATSQESALYESSNNSAFNSSTGFDSGWLCRPGRSTPLRLLPARQTLSQNDVESRKWKTLHIKSSYKSMARTSRRAIKIFLNGCCRIQSLRFAIVVTIELNPNVEIGTQDIFQAFFDGISQRHIVDISHSVSSCALGHDALGLMVDVLIASRTLQVPEQNLYKQQKLLPFAA